MPTTKAEFESSSASQPSAIDCIHVPTSESVWPNQNRRKFRWRWMMRNGLIDGVRELDTSRKVAAEATGTHRMSSLHRPHDMKRFAAAVLLAPLIVGLSRPATQSASFAQFVDRYLDDFARRHPSIAAGNGIHD